jgi:putative ABC transport system permease protein
MTIVSILQGMNKKTLEMYEAMGSNQISVNASAYNGLPLFDDLYDYCLQLDNLVEGVTPQGTMDATVVYGVKNSSSMETRPNLYLGSHQYSLCNNFQIARGRDLSKIDVDEYKNVCVLGSQAAMNFFDLTDPIGEDITVNGVPFTVIGVYAQKDPDSDQRWSLDNMILFPYTASRSLQQEMTFMSEFVVKAKSSTAATEATTRIIGFLTGMLGDPNDPSNQKGYFYVSNQESWKDESQSYLDMYSLVLGGIAGISLLVGGIGIMNIMLVTVTERTREIGIRRAIGAKRKAIVTQFLIESGVICGIGGIIGVGLGTILTLAGSQMLLKMQVLPSPIITLGSVLFAVALGIVFGLYPAIKASGLQPVVALRAD